MASIQRIVPCLWFDGQAEEAAELYTSIFPSSRIVKTARYGEAGREHHRQEPGSVMVVEFELDGQRFVGLNGGPQFQFTEAISLQVMCDDQEEVDYYWEKLGEGGDPNARQCGWLKDRFGLSWQVVPTVVTELLSDPSSERSQRAMEAVMEMKKIDIDTVRRAYDGG
jgi:predicted 3-demethylubiquinone-9 3-methyltransferase (glyoxalase superfamily)